MKNFLMYVLFLLMIISAVGCDSEEEPFIYEHEMLYEQYKQSKPNDWEPLPKTEIGSQTDSVYSDSTEFFDEELTLFENDNYSITVTYPKDDAKARNKVQNAPIITVHSKKWKSKAVSVLPIRDGFYAYDSDGEELTRMLSGSHTPGYYDPYEKDHEPFCWYKITDSGVEFKFLAVEKYFIGNDYLPWAMTEEDYQYITDLIAENGSANESVHWEFIVGDWTATEENLNIVGLQSIVDPEIFNEGIHFVRQGNDSIYRDFNYDLEDIGMTIEQKRLIESRVLKENYTAYMAMITVKVDISEDIPTTELSYEMISPADSDVASIYLSRKDVDYNAVFEEVFSE